MERKYEWEHIRSVPVISGVPDRWDVEEEILCRSRPLLIPPLYWEDLVDYTFYQDDPVCEQEPAVRAYYGIWVTQLYREACVQVPAGRPFEGSVTVHCASRLRQGSVHHARLENCLRDGSTKLRAYLQGIFNIEDLEIYCPPALDTAVFSGDGSVEPYERVFTVWTADCVAGIYREDSEGNLSIVGCSDYLLDVRTQMYPESAPYYAERLAADRLARGTGFRSVFTKKFQPLRSRAEREAGYRRVQEIHDADVRARGEEADD